MRHSIFTFLAVLFTLSIAQLSFAALLLRRRASCRWKTATQSSAPTIKDVAHRTKN